jgi:[ribosomal protein S5]-alanine N-acetyltransferase
MQSKVETNRLFLDLLTMEDCEFMISLVNTKQWIEFIGNSNVHSREDGIAYINKILRSKSFYYWVVRIKESMVPIGVVSFLKRDYLKSFDIGFAFLPEHTGKGYAYEATLEILRIVHSSGEYSPVLATTLPSNVSSIKLLKKLGFQFDHEVEVKGEKLHVYSNSGTAPPSA